MQNLLWNSRHTIHLLLIVGVLPWELKPLHAMAASAIVGLIAFLIRPPREKDSVGEADEGAWAGIRGRLVGIGAFGIYLLGNFPFHPVLGSFGYPKRAADVSSPEQVLRFLQEQNRAIVETAQSAQLLGGLFAGVLVLTLLDVVDLVRSAKPRTSVAAVAANQVRLERGRLVDGAANDSPS